MVNKRLKLRAGLFRLAKPRAAHWSLYRVYIVSGPFNIRNGVRGKKNNKPYEPEAAARSASWNLRGAHDPHETPAAAAAESSSGIVSGASSHPPSCARAAGVGAMRGRQSSLKFRSSFSSRSLTKCGYQSKTRDSTKAVATDKLSDDVKPRKGK